MINITVIGAGPGGYAAAFEAARKGARVTLVERAKLGGTCLGSGCIPTKTLKASADALDMASRFKEFGITTGQKEETQFQINLNAINDRKNKIHTLLVSGLEKTCTQLKIRVLHGEATLAENRIVEVKTAEGNEKITSDAVILATGSRYLDLPTVPVDHKVILNSDDALNVTTLPKRLLIIGGGVIGCELAFIYASFGSKVTVVEGQSRMLPLPSVDEELSRLLQREAKKKGITVHVGKTVKNVTVRDNVAHCVIGSACSETNQEDCESEADMVFVTVGRTANIEGLNLRAVGVATDEKGWIVANERMQTTVPGIYAIGDALGPSRIMLAHVATAEAHCAVRAIMEPTHPMDYRTIPSAIFTSPEIGCVGLTEEQAKEQGFNVLCAIVHMRELGKAHSMGELAGIFKLVGEEQSGKILGVHIAGVHATDCIAEAALAIQNNLRVQDIANTVHAHPTISEGLYEVAEAWLRKKNDIFVA